MKLKSQERGFVLFDVVYEDGSRASNRRVSMEILGGLDGDEPPACYRGAGRGDCEKSGRPRLPVRNLSRSAIKALKLVSVER